MTADVDDLISSLVERDSSASEVDVMVQRLEGMLNVKHADMFEGKAVRAPADWPDAANDALIRLNFNENSGSGSFGFIDKSKIIDLISRLKGLYRNEDEVDNSLEVALSRIPREDLKEIGVHLKRLIKDAASKPGPRRPYKKRVSYLPTT